MFIVVLLVVIRKENKETYTLMRKEFDNFAFQGYKPLRVMVYTELNKLPRSFHFFLLGQKKHRYH